MSRPCAFYFGLQGRQPNGCHKGADCPFSHDPSSISNARPVPCAYHFGLGGRSPKSCTKGDLCPFSHSQSDACRTMMLGNKEVKAAGIILRRPKGEFYLIKDAQGYADPGGKICMLDSTIEEAAAREFEEETGLKAPSLVGAYMEYIEEAKYCLFVLNHDVEGGRGVWMTAPREGAHPRLAIILPRIITLPVPAIDPRTSRLLKHISNGRALVAHYEATLVSILGPLSSRPVVETPDYAKASAILRVVESAGYATTEQVHRYLHSLKIFPEDPVTATGRDFLGILDLMRYIMRACIHFRTSLEIAEKMTLAIAKGFSPRKLKNYSDSELAGIYTTYSDEEPVSSLSRHPRNGAAEFKLRVAECTGQPEDRMYLVAGFDIVPCNKYDSMLCYQFVKNTRETIEFIEKHPNVTPFESYSVYTGSSALNSAATLYTTRVDLPELLGAITGLRTDGACPVRADRSYSAKYGVIYRVVYEAPSEGVGCKFSDFFPGVTASAYYGGTNRELNIYPGFSGNGDWGRVVYLIVQYVL